MITIKSEKDIKNLNYGDQYFIEQPLPDDKDFDKKLKEWQKLQESVENHFIQLEKNKWKKKSPVDPVLEK